MKQNIPLAYAKLMIMLIHFMTNMWYKQRFEHNVPYF
jgi:hypothetical protein